MKLKTWFAIGALAFSAWRGYRNVKKTRRASAKSSLRRMERAI